VPRAYRVHRDGETSGYLGEQSGPFIFASDAAGAYPLLKHARYTSIDELVEDEIARVLERDPAFDVAVQKIAALGFSLEEVRFEDVFLPARQAPLAGPQHEGAQ
jgi:hypothetical protein